MHPCHNREKRGGRAAAATDNLFHHAGGRSGIKVCFRNRDFSAVANPDLAEAGAIGRVLGNQVAELGADFFSGIAHFRRPGGIGCRRPTGQNMSQRIFDGDLVYIVGAHQGRCSCGCGFGHADVGVAQHLVGQRGRNRGVLVSRVAEVDGGRAVGLGYGCDLGIVQGRAGSGREVGGDVCGCVFDSKGGDFCSIGTTKK